ncbi:Putative Zn-dependent protease [Aquiflexum balticum DSM 16537]|uniref:Putative Zn-dependent protease n=1 Tax=Aquiflexum balticum DSM 16537 TaxID=758820 RepID=A0A1W2H3I9_9BACT|nr:M48 family metalloprotease [Aquiflexum balticum]SMD43344.1 Putative Zn-dependent protease [Aquiflexum balticum DSM 16537]
MRRFQFISFISFVLSAIFLIGCARNPVTGKKQLVFMSEAQEIAMGKESDPQIVAFFGLYDDPQLQKFITDKGLEMAAISHRPKLNYEFKVVDSPVINAFAVPGGYVYFTRGIMAHFNNEAEFAGVLGHEIGHITARHSVIQQRNQLLSQLGIIAGVILVPELTQFVEPLSQGMQLALLSFGRDAERQSDKLGVEYSSKIGYDATEMAGFFETLERQQAKSGGEEIPDFLSTHPSPEERNVSVAKLAKEWQEKLKMTDGEVNRNSYLKRIDGLIIGEDPNQGFVENGFFYHPVLKFSFTIPKDWSFQNTPQQIQMAPKNGEALMMLSLISGNSLKEAANTLLEQYKLEQIDSKEERINGLPALVMTADQKQEQVTIRVISTLIQYGGNIYNTMGIAELSKFPTYQPTFHSTMRAFQELKDSDKLNRKPDVIKIKSVPRNMNLKAALQHFGMPEDRNEELAILNGMQLDDELDQGVLIKVVGK